MRTADNQLIGESLLSRAALQARLFAVMEVKLMDADELDELLADEEVVALLTDDILGISELDDETVGCWGSK